MPVWLCRDTALHGASKNGHTETALALVKAGADVHYRNRSGYGFSGLHPRVVGLSQCGAAGLSTRRGAAGVPVWLCRRTALHYASSKCHTEMAMALVKAGADVHCKANDGYGLRAASELALCATGKESEGTGAMRLHARQSVALSHPQAHAAGSR